MKLRPLIQEPNLEFANGSSICPRLGISKYEVYDSLLPARRDRVLLGAVGTSEGLEKLRVWVDRCSRVILSEGSVRQPNLHPDFCGFNKGLGFKASLVYDEGITRALKQSDIDAITKLIKHEDRVEAAVAMFYDQVRFLTQHRNIDVVMCLLPADLYKSIFGEGEGATEDVLESEPKSEEFFEFNFRRALKARCMHLGKPLQISQEKTLVPGAAGQQDDTTRAWNFCTAIYYKANQTVPWKLESNLNRPSVCYAGVSFYRSRDRKITHTSIAQVFDELGKSVILRGAPAAIDKDNSKPYLTEEQAYILLYRALSEYRLAVETSPARLVLHKSSKFRDCELVGFRQAAKEMQVSGLDFVTVLDSDIRLFRLGKYPPYRGTHVEIDRGHHLLYTRGSVPHYRTYTGLYVPQPLDVRIVKSDESPSVICSEILALTKMNWNNTQFDGKYPITIQCARKVGDIMKYLGPSDDPRINYSFYM